MQQVALLTSSVLNRLVNDPARPFPSQDGLMLALILAEANEKIKPFREKVQKVIDDHSGTRQANGLITYAEETSKNLAEVEIVKLEGVQIEISGSKLSITPDWPKLTIGELTVLSPVIKKDT